MKSIKEKQLLVKWSRAMNEPIDPALAEEVDRYNQLQQDIIESVRRNTINDLSDASKVAVDIIKKVTTEYPKPPTLEEVLGIIEEESNELVQAQATQAPPVTEEASPPDPASAREEITPSDLISRAAEHIHKEVKLEENSFQQPNPPLVDKNLEAVQKKLKFLEQAISKIVATGPGSGEVRFLRLDDVNYSSWQDRDRHKILKYEPNNNPAYDGVTFGFLTGDQGEIYSLKYDPYTGYTGNANVAAGLTYYDPQRDTLEILHKDTTRTYAGLDNFIRFKNGLSNTITRGSLVQFIGSDSTDNVPLGGLYVANGASTPLYIMGVSSTDCAPNTLGRAMLLGEIEDINASGTTSGETWNTGDLLWSSPSVAGQLTNVRPTSPNVVVSVAAVMNNGSTSGRLLVRPVIWPRLRSGDFYNDEPQIAANINFAHQVVINHSLFTSGVTLNSNTITVSESGLYKFEARAQLTSTSANQKSIALWFKKNNINVPFSSVRQSVTTNGGYATITNTQIISLTPSDNVSAFYAVTDTTLYIDSPLPIDGSSEIPAFQLTVTQPSL